MHKLYCAAKISFINYKSHWHALVTRLWRYILFVQLTQLFLPILTYIFYNMSFVCLYRNHQRYKRLECQGIDLPTPALCSGYRTATSTAMTSTTTSVRWLVVDDVRLLVLLLLTLQSLLLLLLLLLNMEIRRYRLVQYQEPPHGFISGDSRRPLHKDKVRRRRRRNGSSTRVVSMVRLTTSSIVRPTILSVCHELVIWRLAEGSKGCTCCQACLSDFQPGRVTCTFHGLYRRAADLSRYVYYSRLLLRWLHLQ